MGRKSLLIISKITISVIFHCVLTKLLNIKILSDIIACWPLYKSSSFAADYCLHLQSSGSPTLEAASNSHQIPEDTNSHQQRCTNLHCPKPNLYRTVSSSHLFSCSFVFGSYWWKQVSSMVTNRERKSFEWHRKNSIICSRDWKLWSF